LIFLLIIFTFFFLNKNIYILPNTNFCMRRIYILPVVLVLCFFVFSNFALAEDWTCNTWIGSGGDCDPSQGICCSDNCCSNMEGPGTCTVDCDFGGSPDTLPTCSDVGGSVCSSDQTCSGWWDYQVSDYPGTCCKDGSCESSSVCGNGVCDSDETYNACPQDCAGTESYSCSDMSGTCCTGGTYCDGQMYGLANDCSICCTSGNCVSDSADEYCGDGFCNSGETSSTCSQDCATSSGCTSGSCTMTCPSEYSTMGSSQCDGNTGNCVCCFADADCQSGYTCSDGYCMGDSSNANNYCDGICGNGENSYDCPGDCSTGGVMCGSNNYCEDDQWCADAGRGWCCSNDKNYICDNGDCVGDMNECDDTNDNYYPASDSCSENWECDSIMCGPFGNEWNARCSGEKCVCCESGWDNCPADEPCNFNDGYCQLNGGFNNQYDDNQWNQPPMMDNRWQAPDWSSNYGDEWCKDGMCCPDGICDEAEMQGGMCWQDCEGNREWETQKEDMRDNFCPPKDEIDKCWTAIDCVVESDWNGCQIAMWQMKPREKRDWKNDGFIDDSECDWQGFEADMKECEMKGTRDSPYCSDIREGGSMFGGSGCKEVRGCFPCGKMDDHEKRIDFDQETECVSQQDQEVIDFGQKCPGEVKSFDRNEDGCLEQIKCIQRGNKRAGGSSINTEKLERLNSVSVTDVLKVVKSIKEAKKDLGEAAVLIEEKVVGGYEDMAASATDADKKEDYTMEAARYDMVADTLTVAADKVENIEEKLTAMAEDREIDAENLADIIIDVGDLKEDTINDVIYLMLVDAEVAVEEYDIQTEEVTAEEAEDLDEDDFAVCDDDGCFDERFRSCSLTIFYPDGEGYGPTVKILGLDDTGEKCTMYVFVEDDYMDETIDMTCEFPDYSKGMKEGDNGPDPDYMSDHCVGKMAQYMGEEGPGPGGPDDRYDDGYRSDD
jgi:hypothetical protein